MSCLSSYGTLLTQEGDSDSDAEGAEEEDLKDPLIDLKYVPLDDTEFGV